MNLMKKVLVAIAGGALLAAGIAMIVLPGPALVVIPAALAILAIEFLWARRWLAWLRERLKTIGTNKSSIGPTRNLNSLNTARTQQR